MPSSPPGNAADALAGPQPFAPAGPGFGGFGAILVDAFGERVGLALEARARALIDHLHRHHPDSAAHSVRVAEITMGMWRTASASPEHGPPGAGRPLGHPLGDVETALLGSLLHDVGKLFVPRALLASPHLLAEGERTAMRSHAGRGAALLRRMGFPEPIAAIAQGHHERWSGGGYPTGLPARGQLPITRAVAAADAFDAMTDPGRAYRGPLGRAEALREMAACAGTHFEPAAAALLAESLAAGDQRSSLGSRLRTMRTGPAAHPGLAVVH